MQSLQMRCPVAAIIGLSMAIVANAPSTLPCARSVCISEIFSSSGQPASVTPNGDFWNCPVLRSFRPVAAGILALRVAPDAVVDLVQRLLRVHPGIGQREAVAPAPVVLRQPQHRDAVALDGFNRNQMLRIEPVRHAEQRVAGMCRMALRPSASPRRHSAAPDRALRHRSAASHAVTLRGEAHVRVSAAPIRASSAARSADAVERRGIGVFLHRLALHEQPLAGVDRIQRVGLARQRQTLRPRCRTAWRRSHRDAGQAPRPVRWHPSRQPASGTARAASRRACNAASSAARCSRNPRSSRTSPSRAARSAKLKPKPRVCGSVAGTASIVVSAHLAQQVHDLDPLRGGQRRQRLLVRLAGA